MGGIGSGGQPGTGRKPKDDRTAFVHGREGAKAPKPSAPLATVTMPSDLPAEQAAIWTELAPHALSAHTLTEATASAFRDLCEAIVIKRSMLERIQADGLTYEKVTVDGAGVEHTELKAHPLISQHRGMMQRVEAGYARFRLAPVGKEIAAPVGDADPFDEFEGGPVQ